MESGRIDKILLWSWVILALFFSSPKSLLCVPIKNPSPVLRSGDLFPIIPFSNVLSPEERKNLGTKENETFFLEEIQADLIVIKFLNTNCAYCIKLLPIFDEIYRLIDQDADLRKRIKIVGISTGDAPAEVEALRKNHAIPYPVLLDPEFKAHKEVGEPRVPFIVVARRDDQRRWVVAAVHVGLIFSSEHFVGELQTILTIDPGTFKLRTSGQ